MVAENTQPTLRIITTSDEICIAVKMRQSKSNLIMVEVVGNQPGLQYIYDITTTLHLNNEITDQEAEAIREELVFGGKLDPTYYIQHTGNSDYFPD